MTYLLELARQRQAGVVEYDELLGLIRSDGGGEVVQQIEDFHGQRLLAEHEILSEAERNAIFTSIMEADKLPEEAETPAIPVHRVHFLLRSRWWAAAASVIFLMAGGAWFFLRNNNNSISTITPVAVNAAPGHNGAILTLSDSSQIVLDSAGNGNIAVQGNSKIVKQNGLLSYEKLGSAASREVLYNTMTTPRGRQFQLVLPDGTKVWLNAASSIRFPTAFIGNTREVSITGEAYFEVTKNPRQPFIVNTGLTQVQVLGTHFDLMAYPDEQGVYTTLLEGSVRFTNGLQAAMLVPGEQAGTATRPNAIISVKKTDTDEAVAWVTGKLVIGDADVAKLVRDISRWYDVDMVFEGAVPQRHFWSIINRNVNLSDILKVLDANGIHTRQEGKKIIVSAN